MDKYKSLLERNYFLSKELSRVRGLNSALKNEIVELRTRELLRNTSRLKARDALIHSPVRSKSEEIISEPITRQTPPPNTRRVNNLSKLAYGSNSQVDENVDNMDIEALGLDISNMTLSPPKPPPPPSSLPSPPPFIQSPSSHDNTLFSPSLVLPMPTTDKGKKRSILKKKATPLKQQQPPVKASKPRRSYIRKEKAPTTPIITTDDDEYIDINTTTTTTTESHEEYYEITYDMNETVLVAEGGVPVADMDVPTKRASRTRGKKLSYKEPSLRQKMRKGYFDEIPDVAVL